MSDARRDRRLNSESEMRLRISKARKRLEKADAHMCFDARGKAVHDRAAANDIDLAKAIRDALDVLNALPEGYWKKYPNEYNPLVKAKDL